MNFRVRAATAADAEAIARFNQRLAAETEQTELPWEVILPGVKAVLGDPAKGQYFVAELEAQPSPTTASLETARPSNLSELIGQLLITYEWSDWRNGQLWWLQSVYVAAPFRRQGVFRSLVKFVQNLMDQEPSARGLRLYVEDHNTAAQATYRRLGFCDAPYRLMQVLETDY